MLSVLLPATLCFHTRMCCMSGLRGETHLAGILQRGALSAGEGVDGGDNQVISSGSRAEQSKGA